MRPVPALRFDSRVFVAQPLREAASPCGLNRAFPRICGDSLHRFYAILQKPFQEGEAAGRKNLWEPFDADGKLEAWNLSDWR